MLQYLHDIALDGDMNLKEISTEARRLMGECFEDSHKIDVLLNRLEAEFLDCPSYLRVTEPLLEIHADKAEKFFSALSRVCSGEPLQYVLGYETFYGRKFNVSPSVLIPRPETEELCREVIDSAIIQSVESRSRAGSSQSAWSDSAIIQSAGRQIGNADSKIRILDLCTGSGCIAWTLAAEIQCSKVVAADVSPEALSVAFTQPLHLGNAPTFVLADVLAGPEPFMNDNPALCAGGFDVIVSNPPYVRDSERQLMDSNVLDYEPELALFVPDEDPLLFYRAVAEWAEKLLNPGGICAVEINEGLPEETARLFTGFSSVRVLNDMFSKPRIVFCKDFMRQIHIL